MAPLVALLLVTALSRGVGFLGVDYVASWSGAVAVGLSAMLLLTGVSHFTRTRRAGLVAIVPPLLPKPDALVTVTGVVELATAVGLLIPPEVGPYRQLAAWIVVVLLAVMFPANVYAARARRSESSPHTPLISRTVMQIVFLVSALLVAID